MLLILIQTPFVPFHEAITMLNVSLSLTIADNCVTSLALGDVLFIAKVKVGVVSVTVSKVEFCFTLLPVSVA